MLAVATLWHREVIRFVRQRSRLVGALAQPLVFWLLLGGGLSPSFRPPGAPAGASYLAYLYPGILALVLLFTAIFATISTRSEEHTSELQSRLHLVCRLLLEKKKKINTQHETYMVLRKNLSYPCSK